MSVGQTSGILAGTSLRDDEEYALDYCVEALPGFAEGDVVESVAAIATFWVMGDNLVYFHSLNATNTGPLKVKVIEYRRTTISPLMAVNKDSRCCNLGALLYFIQKIRCRLD